MNEQLADVGLVGLAVMGQNLALNMADHGFRVAVQNRTVATMRSFVAANPGTPGGLVGCEMARDLVAALRRPRRIVMMVQAGRATDAVISALALLLEAGDVLIDGGNSLFTDTIRRERELAGRGILFVGSGVSGGEEGARFGPSLMPGGASEAYAIIEPVWTAIAARVDAESGRPIEGAAPGRPVTGGVPCTTHIGPDGAGHYVKMVHNGIEYGDMQMIAEAYHVLRELGGMTPSEMAPVFAGWNRDVLDSFLIEITADILGQSDPSSGNPFVDVVLDAAGQKGTGKWTSVNALDMGVPAPTIAEAVFARCLSAVKEERVVAATRLAGPAADAATLDRASLADDVRDALFCAKVCSYAQGFQLMRAAQAEQGWQLDLGAIASIWRGGCIIRAGFLQKITEAYGRDGTLANLLLDPYFAGEVGRRQAGWRRVVALAASRGVPAPTFMSALSYYDGYRSERLPANLLQAQRDYFGAHTYERTDRPRGKFFHLDWPAEPRREHEV